MTAAPLPAELLDHLIDTGNKALNDHYHGDLMPLPNPQTPWSSMPITINPGTGPLPEFTRAAAAENMARFVEDLAQAGTVAAGFAAAPGLDYGEGRYAFLLELPGGRSTEVQMPGMPVDQLRYMEEPGQHPIAFPRMYVDGSSWLWCYALSRCATDED
ncbi:hypothetical protein ACIRPK_23770 [Kitasatospora sp. NPDC101801]|uniref:hypothetical protein n=1 Tax=Kitasatospora sp. NPDC101801 TaxID=3364103 RepID=UPI003820950F